MADALIVRRGSGYGDLSIFDTGMITIPINNGFSTDRYGTFTFSEPIDPRKIVAMVCMCGSYMYLRGGYESDYEVLTSLGNHKLDILSLTETQMEVYLAEYPSNSGYQCNVRCYFYMKQ